MNTLHMIYASHEYKSMINFDVDITSSYDDAYDRYGAKKYNPHLLQAAKMEIQLYGNAIEMPKEFSQHMTDQELDAFLMALHKDVDQLIKDHLYVRVPRKHATTFLRLEDQTIWILNGIGESEALLASMNEEKRVFINIVDFNKLRDEFVIYKRSHGIFERSVQNIL